MYYTGGLIKLLHIKVIRVLDSLIKKVWSYNKIAAN